MGAGHARERPTEQQAIDFSQAIHQTVRPIRSQKQAERITIVQDLAENVPGANGDVNQLQQVLLNLSLNGCEAMPDGGTLKISTMSRDGKVLIKVVDTGCGIGKEHLDHIFEPFFSTKPVGKGTGLGLSVTYGIVEQYGGALELKTEENKGMTFTIILPSAYEEPLASRDEQAEP